jgi:hypothetical protein
MTLKKVTMFVAALVVLYVLVGLFLGSEHRSYTEIYSQRADVIMQEEGMITGPSFRNIAFTTSDPTVFGHWDGSNSFGSGGGSGQISYNNTVLKIGQIHVGYAPTGETMIVIDSIEYEPYWLYSWMGKDVSYQLFVAIPPKSFLGSVDPIDGLERYDKVFRVTGSKIKSMEWTIDGAPTLSQLDVGGLLENADECLLYQWGHVNDN